MAPCLADGSHCCDCLSSGAQGPEKADQGPFGDRRKIVSHRYVLLSWGSTGAGPVSQGGKGFPAPRPMPSARVGGLACASANLAGDHDVDPDAFHVRKVGEAAHVAQEVGLARAGQRRLGCRLGDAAVGRQAQRTPWPSFAWASIALGAWVPCAGQVGTPPRRLLWLRGVTRPRRVAKGREWGAWAVTGAVWIGAVIDASCFNRDKGVYSLRALSLVFRATSSMSVHSHDRT